MPSGDVKIGSKDYTVAMHNSPHLIAAINNFPIKTIDGKTVFVRDVAHVHDGYRVQTNSVTAERTAGSADAGPQTGGVSTLAVIEGVKRRCRISRLLPKGVSTKPIFDQSIFEGSAEQRDHGRC